MTCGNCGFQNAAGDEFCGSCGQFLAWTGGSEDSTRAAVVGASGSVPPPPSEPLGPPPPPAQPQTNYQATPWPAGLQRCDACGTANELNRTFCVNCGAKLPRVGTTGGLAAAASARNRGMNWRPLLYLIGGLIIILLFAGIAFVAFGGLNPPGAAPASSTPAASLIAANSGATLLPPASAPASLGVPASGQPLSTPPPSLEPPPTTVSPTPEITTPPPATTPPATAPPPGGFVCAASTFSAAQPGGWKVVRAHWSRKGLADTLSLEMQASSSSSTAGVDASILPPDQVQGTYGVPGPASGSLAVVLSFNDAVTLSAPFGSPVGYKALQEFQIYRTAGRVVVVMGVKGSGCYSLSSEAWATGSSAMPELDVAIQR